MTRTTILTKDADIITVRTDQNGTFVQATRAGNRQFGDDRHDEVVDDYKRQGWTVTSDQKT
jgi:hypothetical protein